MVGCDPTHHFTYIYSLQEPFCCAIFTCIVTYTPAQAIIYYPSFPHCLQNNSLFYFALVHLSNTLETVYFNLLPHETQHVNSQSRGTLALLHFRSSSGLASISFFIFLDHSIIVPYNSLHKRIVYSLTTTHSALQTHLPA